MVPGDNKCPQTVLSHSSEEMLKLDLDEVCNAQNIRLKYNTLFDRLKYAFDFNCQNKQECQMDLTVEHWPEECQGYASDRYGSIEDLDVQTLGTSGFKQKNLYVVSECWTHPIQLAFLDSISLDHEIIGYISASIDVLVMFILFISLMFIQMQVLVDYERQRNG